jgi:hypothetical protein
LATTNPASRVKVRAVTTCAASLRLRMRVLSPTAFNKFIVDETAKSQQVVRAAGIKLN